jgi:hypothetical protein
MLADTCVIPLLVLLTQPLNRLLEGVLPWLDSRNFTLSVIWVALPACQFEGLQERIVLDGAVPDADVYNRQHPGPHGGKSVLQDVGKDEPWTRGLAGTLNNRSVRSL